MRNTEAAAQHQQRLVAEQQSAAGLADMFDHIPYSAIEYPDSDLELDIESSKQEGLGLFEGFLADVQSAFPNQPDMIAIGSERNYQFAVDLPTIGGESIPVDIDFSQYSSWIELFRNVILFVCVWIFWFRVVELIRAAYAGKA